MITPLLLSVAIMAFGIGVFYLTLSGDLPDPGKKCSASTTVADYFTQL